MLAQAPGLAQARRLATILNFQASVFPHVDDPQTDSTFAGAVCRIYRYGSRAQCRWRSVYFGLRRTWQWTRNKHGSSDEYTCEDHRFDMQHGGETFQRLYRRHR
jgi:hypothetical protein